MSPTFRVGLSSAHNVIKKIFKGVGEMAHILKTLATLADELDSVPSTNMAAKNCL